MQTVAEYLERCQHFCELAASEKNPAISKQLEEQAVAYFHLAARRAGELGQPIPRKPPLLGDATSEDPLVL
jgi:hypothetical protein